MISTSTNKLTIGNIAQGIYKLSYPTSNDEVLLTETGGHNRTPLGSNFSKFHSGTYFACEVGGPKTGGTGLVRYGIDNCIFPLRVSNKQADVSSNE